MNAPATKKPLNKTNVKSDKTKAAADQDKNINQLLQEIKNLSKAITGIQQNPDMQTVIVSIPQTLFIKLNTHLIGYSKDMGETVTLSRYISDAIDFCICCEEQTEAEEKIQEKNQ